MITTTMTMKQVTEVTGLERVEIYRAQELAALGAPGHFGYRGAEQVYTAEGVRLLVEGLRDLGHASPALSLEMALAARAHAARPKHWLARWQDQQEEAA